MAAGMTDLAEMLRQLDVEIRPESYVFAAVPPDASVIFHADAVIREMEDTTVVVSADVAAAHGLPDSPRFAWLTLTIHSSLEAVGLTAAFSAALAAEGISCNVLAGYHHDHLLVPEAARDRAVAVLRTLSRS